jgi:hypothetical protein
MLQHAKEKIVDLSIQYGPKALIALSRIYERSAEWDRLAGLGGGGSDDPLPIGIAAVVITTAIVASLALTSWRLTRFEVRGGD